MLVCDFLLHLSVNKSDFTQSTSCLHEHAEKHGLSTYPVAGMVVAVEGRGLFIEMYPEETLSSRISVSLRRAKMCTQ